MSCINHASELLFVLKAIFIHKNIIIGTIFASISLFVFHVHVFDYEIKVTNKMQRLGHMPGKPSKFGYLFHYFKKCLTFNYENFVNERHMSWK